MPGTLLNAIARHQIADSFIEASKFINDRKGLIAIYTAARAALVKGELFDEVMSALASRAFELGVYRKGTKKNA